MDYHLDYVSSVEILNLIKPFATSKKVWAKIVEARFKKKKVLCGPDLFLYRAEKAITGLHLSNLIILLARLLETLSMEMDVVLIAKRK